MKCITQRRRRNALIKKHTVTIFELDFYEALIERYEIKHEKSPALRDMRIDRINSEIEWRERFVHRLKNRLKFYKH